jgi:DNA (cytosine-5)-methyltransferase 1
MKVVGLFAGIGGFEVGLGQAGHETLLTCEVWEPAKSVLHSRLSGIPNHGDIRDLASLPGDTGVVCAGFPCQDLSQAGRTAGIGGARSALVSHVFRLLDTCRPMWLVLENVSFMLHLDRGRALNRLVSALEDRGFRWAYRVVNTLAFLPQRRERVFLVASSEEDPAAALLVDEVHPCQRETRLDEHAHGFYWTEGTRGLGWAADAVPTLKNGSTIGIPSPPAILMPSGVVIQPDIRDAERLQGFPADWTAPAECVSRRSQRWALIGNAVSVPVAGWLGRRLLDPGQYDRSRDCPLPLDGRWCRAARWDGKKRHAVRLNTFPAWQNRPPLHEFLQFPGRPLSAKATEGFLRRADASTLHFVDGFKEKVRAHLRAMANTVSELGSQETRRLIGQTAAE